MNKFESNYTDPLSYSTIKNLIGQFRRSNGSEGSDFNKFETLGQYYFKILFYFNNPGQDALTSNLLGCDWITEKYSSNESHPNSAYNYLVMNDELERAKKLQQFIFLLSDINSQSPWYWQSISGLDTALERKIITDNDFKLEDRKSIVIKCLPDAYDNRIGTLLDLYRSICYSYTNKKEIVPANLRKFDMGIYIFNSPIYNDNQMDYNINPETGKIDGERIVEPYISANNFRNDFLFRTSSKYIELHNCEIDYNSSKTAYGDLNNADGKSNEYSITIFFDDAYENRYNEFVTSDIGDFIKVDLLEHSNQNYDYRQEYEQNTSTIETQKQLFTIRHISNSTIREKWPNELTNKYKDGTKNSFLDNVIDQTVGHVSEKLKTFGKSIYLGNLYGLSLSKVRDQVKDVMSGNLFNTVNAIQDYVEHANREKGEMESLENRTLWDKSIQQQRRNNTTQVEKPVGNLWDVDTENDIIKRGYQNNQRPSGNLWDIDYAKNDIIKSGYQNNQKPSGSLWDVDYAKNDIIKRGQQSSLLNTKRSLFQ